MHIVYLTSWYPQNDKDLNGCFFREQAHALAKAGNKVGVIAPQFRSLRLGKKAVVGSYGEEIWQDDLVITFFGHNVFWFPKVPYLDLNRWTTCCLKLFESYVKKKGKPDIIHVQSMTLAGAAALEIHKKYKIPFCIMEHSSTFARGLVSHWHYKVLMPVIKASAYNMAVSQDLADLLNKQFSVDDWHYFPNLLDKLFSDKNDTIHVVNKQLCSFGGLVPIKGFDLLIKAIAALYKDDPDCTLIIAGEGGERKNLQQLAASLGVSQAVQFLGAISREQVKGLMASSCCYMLSSHIETFGVVVIEALSQGTPVISTRCGGPESILTLEDGVFVPINSVEAMADAMIYIINNEHNYDREQIRQRCLAEFSEAAFIKGMVEIYQSFIDK